MSTKKIMLVRHAETPAGDEKGVTPQGDSDKEALAVRGWQRAGAMVGLFSPATGHFSHPRLATPQRLYAPGIGLRSKGLHSRHTLQPLADRLSQQIDTAFLNGHETRLARTITTVGGVVLVAWEHQTLPDIAEAILGRDEAFPHRWPDDRFDLVWVFDRQTEAGAWTFAQVPQLLLARDQATVIPLPQTERGNALERWHGDKSAETSKWIDKLTSFVSGIIEKNDVKIISMIVEKTGELSLAALRDEHSIETIATYIHALLPNVVRVAVPERKFTEFIKDNRERFFNQVLNRYSNSMVTVVPGRDVAENIPALIHEAPSLAPGARLSGFKDPGEAPELGAFRSIYFPSLKASLEDSIGQFDRLIGTARADRAQEGKFSDIAYKRHLAQLSLRLTSLCLDFPNYVVARNPQWASSDEIIIHCDQVIVEVMAYCLASASYLLANEVGYSKDEVAKFIAPLIDIILAPYFRNEAAGADRACGKLSIQDIYQPAESVEDSPSLKRFNDGVRRLSANKYRKDPDSLLVNFAKNLLASVRELFGSRKYYLRISRKISESNDVFKAIFEEMDSGIERYLADFLENTRR